MKFTQSKFKSLEKPQQHRKASQVLRMLWQDIVLEHNAQDLQDQYNLMCTWAQWPKISFTVHDIGDRFHWHVHLCGHGVQEDQYLSAHTKKEASSPAPFLPITVYLDRLRSAHNIGSITRTLEAMRIGQLVFPSGCTNLLHHKAARTSMGTASWVPWCEIQTIDECPKPWIALENCPDACNLYDFHFPQSFTLILGNEEEGIHADILSRADACVKIPLVGQKNCLNVANAFAICAYEIRRQYPQQVEYDLNLEACHE